MISIKFLNQLILLFVLNLVLFTFLFNCDSVNSKDLFTPNGYYYTKTPNLIYDHLEPYPVLSYDFLKALRSYNYFVDKFDQQLLNKQIAKALNQKYSQYNKRNCLINAGMSQTCDFKELVSAVNARKFWESSNSPGKRRKRSLLKKNLI